MPEYPITPISTVYFGKKENHYYVRYQQPSTGNSVFLTEPCLELLAEIASELNIVKGKGTRLNEKSLERRLSKDEYGWLIKYIKTPEKEQVKVSLHRKDNYEVSFLSAGSKVRKHLPFDTLPAVIEFLQEQKVDSHRVRREKFPWQEYASLLSHL